MKQYVFLTAITLLFYGNLWSYQQADAAGRRPNVLLILTDNQSYYELSSNGHPIVQTPHLDRFADQGVVFNNFYASPYCSPSRAELLTGRYALRTGVHNTIGGVTDIAADESLVSDYLQENGYATAIFGKWHLGNAYPYSPQYRGFDTSFIFYGGILGGLSDYYGNAHMDAHFRHNGEVVSTKGYSTDVLFRRAKAFIDENKEQPFFCFISTPVTHGPYQPHPEKLQELQQRGVVAKKQMAIYSMIENVDDNVGAILDYLKSEGLRDNTLVIVASDQGMRYRGLADQPPTKHFGLPDNVFDYRHKVFCMMQYPGLVTSPRRSSSLTGIIDITPTILEVCDIAQPGNMDGQSLKPLLAGNDAAWDEERNLVIQCPRQRERAENKNVSVKTAQWRLLDGKLLFDAEADPYQLRDVAGEYPTVVESLNRVYQAFWNSLPPEDEILPARHYLGARQAPQTRLDARSWYRGDAPFYQGQLEEKDHQGVWPVKICRSGRYRFELRRFPREADKPIGAAFAAIAIGHAKAQTSLDKTDHKAILEMELEQGDYDMRTYLAGEQPSGKIQKWGAYYVYVSYLE